MSKNLGISNLLDFYGEILSEKQREAIEFYYNDDLSLSEIAQNQGISKQGVRDTIIRAENQLVFMEEKLNLFHKFQTMNSNLELIINVALEIKDLIPKNEKIQELTSTIIDSAKFLLEE